MKRKAVTKGILEPKKTVVSTDTYFIFFTIFDVTAPNMVADV